MSPYQQFKGIVTDVLPLTHDALHVLAGLCIHLLLCAVFKKPLHWKVAFLSVALIECVAEFQDRIDDMRVYGVWIWRESAKDFVLTVTPSILLFVYSKFKR